MTAEDFCALKIVLMNLCKQKQRSKWNRCSNTCQLFVKCWKQKRRVVLPPLSGILIACCSTTSTILVAYRACWRTWSLEAAWLTEQQQLKHRAGNTNNTTQCDLRLISRGKRKARGFVSHNYSDNRRHWLLDAKLRKCLIKIHSTFILGTFI